MTKIRIETERNISSTKCQ